jgi:hypothetical protein
MSYFNIDLYEPVENRIQAFWKKFPDGRIITDLQRTERTDGRVEWVCRTEAFTNREDARPQATGFATEIEGSSVINRANASENCETSSIGRCLANLGFAAKGKRPSREEMEKVARANQNNRAKAPKKNLAEGDLERLLAGLSACNSLADLNAWSGKAATFAIPDEKRLELFSIFKVQRESLTHNQSKIAEVA